MDGMKKSRIVSCVSYDKEAKEMTVHLHGGKVYTYPNVTPAEHGAFVNSPSLGRHFAAVVALRPHKR